MNAEGSYIADLPDEGGAIIPPDFNFILPSGEIVRGVVWFVTKSQIVEDGYTFSSNWAMETSRRGVKMRWVLIEDVG